MTARLEVSLMNKLYHRKSQWCYNSPMSCDQESENWAKIWLVAEELQGHQEPNKKTEKVIRNIGKLRAQGKLSPTQEKALDGMAGERYVEYDF